MFSENIVAVVTLPFNILLKIISDCEELYHNLHFPRQAFEQHKLE